MRNKVSIKLFNHGKATPFDDTAPKVSGLLYVFNTIALRTAKTPQSFGRSECNRIKMNEWQ